MEKTVGKYKIVREIGKGGMGVVYKGLDPATQQSVAIKILPAANVDRTTVERFNREAQAMAKVKHPNLIEIFDHGMAQGEHYLVMEFVDGDSLKNYLKHRGKLSVTECLEITLQLIDALSCIHGEGMIHRDIKPGNIMITSGARVKLMDLGLVHIPGVTRVTVAGAAVGTAEYMSPEQIADQGIDTRSDIYSLGITIYEMLAGQPPFVGDTIQAVLMKQRNEAPPSLRSARPDVPEGLVRIIEKAMAKDIKVRYQRIQELLADIQKFKGQGGSLADVAPAKPAASSTEKPAVMTRPAAPTSSPRPVPVAPRAISSEKKSSPVGAVIGLIVLAVGFGLYHQRAQVGPMVSGAVEWIQASLKGKKHLANEAEEILANLEKAEEHYARGQEFSQEGDLEKAVTEFQQAIQLRPDHGIYYHDLAMAYEKMDRKSLATSTWQNLLQNDSSSSYAELARQRIAELTR